MKENIRDCATHIMHGVRGRGGVSVKHPLLSARLDFGVAYRPLGGESEKQPVLASKCGSCVKVLPTEL